MEMPQSFLEKENKTLMGEIARSNRGTYTEMWYICTMEYYSAITNNDFVKFIGKWMELETIILSEVTQSRKNTHGMYSLINGY